MKDQNIIEFEVEGLGKFKAFKEVPAKTFFFDRRNELAKLLGGRVDLVRMESTMRLYANSTDPLEKKIADDLAYEMMRANGFLEIKNLLVQVPKGFNLDSVSGEEFDKLWVALESARGTFRQENARTPEGTPGSVESQG